MSTRASRSRVSSLRARKRDLSGFALCVRGVGYDHVKGCSLHVPTKGGDIGVDKMDAVFAMIHETVLLCRLKEVRLKFHAYHLVSITLFRNIDRYDTTTGTDIQQPFMPFQDHEGGEEDRVDREPVSLTLLYDPQFFIAQDLEGFVLSYDVTHTCRTQGPSGSWGRRTSISGACRGRSRQYPSPRRPLWGAERMPDRWSRFSRNRQTTHGPP